MAAHMACDFSGGKAEKLALAKYCQVLWQGRVLNSQFTDEELSEGHCPLTSEEIRLLAAALGFDNNTLLYLSSHEIYSGWARISMLCNLFPLMEDKKSLSSAEERTKIEGKASLLAAVDYYVSMHSDVFASASLGSMHNAQAAREVHKNRHGQMRLREATQSTYTDPAPVCMCQVLLNGYKCVIPYLCCECLQFNGCKEAFRYALQHQGLGMNISNLSDWEVGFSSWGLSRSMKEETCCFMGSALQLKERNAQQLINPINSFPCHRSNANGHLWFPSTVKMPEVTNFCWM